MSNAVDFLITIHRPTDEVREGCAWTLIKARPPSTGYTLAVDIEAFTLPDCFFPPAPENGDSTGLRLLVQGELKNGDWTTF